MKKADRYTVLLVRPGDLVKQIDAARNLGLVWFIRNNPGTALCAMYLFFDQAGMDNYLAGHYDEEVKPGDN